MGKVEIWLAPGFTSIQLHRGQDVTQTYPRHWHDELYLGAILSGNGFLEYSGASHVTPMGTFMLVPPGEVHANHKQRCTFQCMFIDCKSMHAIAEAFVERAIPSINYCGGLIHNAQTFASFVELHKLLDSKSPTATLRADSAVSHFIFSIVKRHALAATSMSPTSGQENVAILKAQEFLNEHYADRVTLGEIARLTGLSPFHLNRSFCQKIGIPPHAYQIQVRISRAKSLLRSGRGISDTALSTGFVDQSHFSHQFRKFVGLTPGQYVRQSKKVQDANVRSL